MATVSGGRLCPDDLVLVDQTPDEKARALLMRIEESVIQARRADSGTFVEIHSGQPIAATATVIGHLAVIPYGVL